ncbi:MAG: penicillin-binding transpeptidase domain-containing protein [Ruminococcus sp.]
MANKPGKKKSDKGALQLLRSRTTYLIIIILVIGFGAIISRLAYLQLIQGSYLQEKAVEQQLRDTTISAKRGTIYDAKGKVLAQSASVWKVVLAPAYFENNTQRKYVAKGLSKILELDYKEVYKKTKQKSYYVIIKSKIETDARNKVLKFMDKVSDKYRKLSNVIDLVDDYKRYYPYGDLASSVIGFTGSDDQGLEGVEYKYDEYLTGTPGRRITAKNGNQTDMPFQYEQNEDPEDGNSITLTVDETIQSIAEKYMKQGIIDNNVINRGVCIIMDVNTGGILAMVTADGYDLNNPYDLPQGDLDAIRQLPEDKRAVAESSALSAMWRNKAIADTYYPGSVFKMCTASMALNEGLVNENSTFSCGGVYTVGGEHIGCHVRSGHGTQNLYQCIYNSCNPAFIQIGFKVGAEKYWNYYKAFGFSERTDIDLPGESEDIFFSEDGSMSEVDLAVSSFGQGISITPIQMITACSAIVNGGKVMQPYVVQSIADAEGNVIKNVEPTVKRQVISQETSKKMCEFLERNSVQGGAYNGYIAGYHVGGKTGTSEKLKSTNGSKDYIASFCGFAPANDPKVACLVFFDTPKGNSYYGAQVSSPVFINIMSEVLPYLEIQTEYTDDEIQYIDTVAGSYIGLSTEKAEKQAKSDGFTVTIKGEGDKVISQIPSPATKIPTDGNVVLYTDEESESQTVTVPNLVGYNISEVNSVATAYGLNVSITGSISSSGAVAVSQSIDPGSLVSQGTVVTVKFGSTGTVTD